MPSLSMYKLSPPTDSVEFERMLVDYAKSVYHVQATLYGRKGQNQHGIDVIVETEPRICIQCKDYQATTVTTRKIDSWVQEADSSEISFGSFVIAVAGIPDAKIQDYVYRLSDLRRSKNKFAVSIIFWNDIEHTIKVDPNLLRIYYPEYYITSERIVDAYHIKHQQTEEIQSAINSYESHNNQAAQNVLINSESELRKKCLELVVKHHIQEFLRVDPFTGFLLDLVSDADVFHVEMQIIQDKAISMSNWSVLLETLGLFIKAVDSFNALLSRYCQVDNSGQIVRIPPIQDNGEGLVHKIEERRRAAQGLLKSISEWK